VNWLGFLPSVTVPHQRWLHGQRDVTSDRRAEVPENDVNGLVAAGRLLGVADDLRLSLLPSTLASFMQLSPCQETRPDRDEEGHVCPERRPIIGRPCRQVRPAVQVYA
jgi:hypothetical protein